MNSWRLELFLCVLRSPAWHVGSQHSYLVVVGSRATKSNRLNEEWRLVKTKEGREEEFSEPEGPCSSVGWMCLQASQIQISKPKINCDVQNNFSCHCLLTLALPW
jgi:hypothetical protein